MVDSKGKDVELPKEVAEALNLPGRGAKKNTEVEDAGVGGLATPTEAEVTTYQTFPQVITFIRAPRGHDFIIVFVALLP